MSLPPFTNSESDGNYSEAKKTIEFHYNERLPHEFARIKQIYRRAKKSNSGINIKVLGASPNKTLVLTGTRNAVHALLTVPRSPYRSPPKSVRTTQKIPGGIAARRSRRNRTRSTFS